MLSLTSVVICRLQSKRTKSSKTLLYNPLPKNKTMLDKKKRMAVIGIMLVIAIGSFTRISANGNIRAVEFVSVWTIGVLSGLLIRNLLEPYFKKEE